MAEAATADLRSARERLVREHMVDENTLNFDAVLKTFPHPHYEIIPTGAVYDGHEQVRAYYRDSRAAFPDQRNEIISLRHADDAVIVEFWLRGTQRGAFRGIPATGNAFETRMCAYFIFENEKLVCERVYFDSLTLLKQLLKGVNPLMPGGLKIILGLLRGMKGGFK